MVLFLVVVALLEFLIIYTSMSFGLKDMNPLIWKVASFTISISPLFDLLPLGVIIVLSASWIYLTRTVTYGLTSAQPERTKRPLPPPRKYEKKHLKTLRRFIRKIDKKIEDAGRNVKQRISKSRLAQYLEQHLAGKTVLKSALTVLLPFSALALIVYVIIYPQLIPNAVNSLLGGGNSSFDGFVVWTVNGAKAIGKTLSPLGWIAANIDSGLASIALGFRNGVIGLTTPIINPLVQLNLTGKYVLSQNVAAWASAIVALYAGRPGRRRR